MRPVAIYVRASTEHQQYSTSNQSAALMLYAIEHQFEVVRAYEDNGRSGLDLRRRHGLQELLNVALSKKRPFDTLLVYDISRWGRFQDIDESAHYEFICRKAGLEIIYCAEPFQNDGTSISNLLKTMKRVMAAQYSEELSRKVLAGQCHLASIGKLVTAPPYGMRRLLVDKDGRPKGILTRGERKSIQTDHALLTAGPPEEIAVVKRIFRMFVEDRLSDGQIARILTAEGLPTPCNADAWSSTTVLGILKNEKYIGNLLYNKSTRKLNARWRPNPEDLWIRVNGVTAPIVSPELFQRAQEKIAGRSALSDAALLELLRRLYEREGKVSRRLINAEPGMPTDDVYIMRFGNLTNLFGWLRKPERSPYLPRRPHRFRSVEVLIAELKAVMHRHGRLSRRIIDGEASLATVKTYVRVFGSMANAYAAVGYQPQDPRQSVGVVEPQNWLDVAQRKTRTPTVTF